MDEDSRRAQFKSGLRLSGFSIILLPAGLLAIGGGPCAGPRNALGSAILLLVGAGAVALGIYGVFRTLRGIRAASWPLWLVAAVSLSCASFAVLAGGAYLFIGILSLDSFLRY